MVAASNDEPIALREFASAWFSEDPAHIQSVIADLVTQVGGAVDEARQVVGGRLRLVGLGIASLAESGVLVDSDGTDLTPVIPWFDSRGDEQLRMLPTEFGESFSAATGLPLTAQWSLSKLLWFQSQGLRVRGVWLSLGEYVAYRLTGQAFAEPSLASRTGFVDQDRQAAYAPACRLLQADRHLLPPLRQAGQVWGTGRKDTGVIAGVPVTVAGHDHLVAAYAHQVVDTNDILNSFGTADAIVRVRDADPDAAGRIAITREGWTYGRHVVPGRFVLLGGTQGGLVLRRVVSLIGRRNLQAVDDEVIARCLLEEPDLQQRVNIRGAGLLDGNVTITIHQDVTAAELWASALQHVTAELAKFYRKISTTEGQHRVVAAGGWFDLQAVRAARRSVFPTVDFSSLQQAGALGAAVLGRVAGVNN